MATDRERLERAWEHLGDRDRELVLDLAERLVVDSPARSAPPRVRDHRPDEED